MTTRPSNRPSSAPSYNLDDYASDARTRALYSRFLDDREKYAKRANESFTFGNYFYKGINVQGSCADWKYFVAGSVSSPFSGLYFTELTAAFSDYDFATKRYSNYSAFTCSATASTDPYINDLNQVGIDKLVNGLLTGESAEYYCSGANWRVYSCSPGYRVLCVNCKEKCTESVYCPAKAFAINSCASCSNHAAAAAILNMKFASQSLYPEITSMAVAANDNNTIDVEVVFEGSGIVYCAAFDAYNAIDSLVRIKSAGESATKTSTGAEPIAVTLATGLAPSTVYDVYCYTESLTRNIMTYEAALATKTTVSTKCCRAVTFPVAYSSISVVSSAAESPLTFQLALNARPVASTDVHVALYSYVCALTTSSSAAIAVPAAFTFTASSTFLTGSFVVAGTAGCYTLTASAANGAYNSSLFDLQITDTPSAPVMQKALFSNDGLKILLSFDLPGNRPRSNATMQLSNDTSDAFPCKAIVYFAGIGSSLCEWRSSTLLVATLSGTVTAVGDIVRFYSGLLRSSCYRASGDCTDYPVANEMHAEILSAESPVVPVVSLTLPSQISSCDALTVNPIATTGQAGRPWLGVTWRVTAQSTDSTYNSTTEVLALTKLLRAKGAGADAIITVPASYLTQGVTYSISLKVENFLAKSAYGFAEVYKTAVAATPRVSIQGPSEILRYRADPIELMALAAVPPCSTTSYGRAITYNWLIYSGGALLSFESTSTTETHFFRLDPFTLESATAYRVKVVATVASTEAAVVQVTSSAYVDLYIGSSGVSAAIAGGSHLTLSSAHVSSVASASVDLDYPSSTSLLSFAWNCVEFAPSYGSSCDGFDYSQGSVAVASISGLRTGHTYDLTVLVSNVNTARAASASQRITIVAEDLPQLTLASAEEKYDPLQRLVLSGLVKASAGCQAQWALTATTSGASLDLAGVALTPLSQYIGSGSYVYQLAIPANTLSPGYAYTLTLSAGYGSAQASAAVVVVMNAPPVGGAAAVSPSAGYALNTTFLLSTSSWSDDASDYPLSYSFSYYTTSSTDSRMVKRADEVSFAYSRLAQGVKFVGYALTVAATCLDSYGGSANATASVTVSPLVSTAVLADAMGIALSSAFVLSDPMAVTQIVSAAAAAANTADCTGLPAVCSSLGRRNCETSPRTCGRCLAGYIGIDGDSNIACAVAGSSTSFKKVGEACSKGPQCLSGKCLDAVCVDDQKTCPASCSGRGACVYLDDVGGSVAYCSVTDSSCRASCVCSKRYFGRDCASSASELSQLQLLRESMCTSLQSAAQLQEVSQDALLSRIKMVADIFLDINQVSSAALATCTALLVDAITDHPAFSSDPSFAGPAAEALSSVLENGQSLPSALLQDLKDALSSLLQGVQAALAVGEAPYSLLTTNFRVSTVVVDATALLGTVVTAAQSDVEKLAGANPRSLAISYTGSGSGAYDMTTAGVSIIQYLKVPELSLGTNSTAIGLETVVRGVDNRRRKLASTDFTVVVVLANRERIDYISFTSTNISVFCHREDRTPYTLPQVCPSGFSFDALCPGTLGFFNFTCPGKKTLPQCLSWDGAAYSPDPACEVLGYTPYNTTCKCSGAGRVAASGAVTQQLSSAFVVQTQAFEKFWFPSPTPAGSTYSAIPATFSASIFIVFVLGLMLFLRYDMEEREVALDKRMFRMKAQAEQVALYAREQAAAGTRALAALATACKDGLVFYTAEYLGIYLQPQNKPQVKRSVVVPVDNDSASAKAAEPVVEDDREPPAPAPITDTFIEESGQAARNERTIARFFVSLIPPEFQKANWRESLWKWVLLEHPWLSLFANFNSKRDYRFAKFLLAAGKYIAILFFTAVLVRNVYPDDGSCEAIKYEDECNNKMTILSVRNACHWLQESEYCFFTEPVYDFLSIVALVIVVTTLTLPVSGVIEFCVPKVSELVRYHSRSLKERRKKGKELQETGSKVDGKAEYWQKLVVDELKGVQTTVGSRLVLALRLQKMHEYGDYLLPSLEAESMIHVANDDFRRLSRQALVTSRGLQHRIAKSDTLSRSRYSFYAPDRQALINKISETRAAAEDIKRRLYFIEDQNDKEVYLMRHFLVNSFAGYKKRIVKRYAFDPYEVKLTDDSGKNMERSLCLLALVITLALAGYLTLSVGSQIGSKSFMMFIVIAMASLVEDIILLQTVRIFLVYIVMTSLVAGEYRRILEAMIRRYKHITWRRLGVLGDAHSLVHHLNPACRAARTFPQLPISRFFVLLNDHDVPLFSPQKSFADSKSPLALLSSLYSGFFYVVTILPPIVQNCMLDVLGTCCVNALIVLFFLVGTASPLIGGLAAAGFVGAIVAREYVAYKDLTDRNFSGRLKVLKMDARRRVRATTDFVRWALQIKSKEERELAKMVKQAQRAKNGDATMAKYASSVKVSTEGFKPYESRGIVTAARSSAMSDAKVPLGSLYAASASSDFFDVGSGSLEQSGYQQELSIYDSSFDGDASPTQLAAAPALQTRMKPQFSRPPSINTRGSARAATTVASARSVTTGPPLRQQTRATTAAPRSPVHTLPVTVLGSPINYRHSAKTGAPTASQPSLAFKRPKTVSIASPSYAQSRERIHDARGQTLPVGEVSVLSQPSMDGPSVEEVVSKSLANMERLLMENVQRAKTAIEKHSRQAKLRGAQRSSRSRGAVAPSQEMGFYSSEERAEGDDFRDDEAAASRAVKVSQMFSHQGEEQELADRDSSPVKRKVKMKMKMSRSAGPGAARKRSPRHVDESTHANNNIGVDTSRDNMAMITDLLSPVKTTARLKLSPSKVLRGKTAGPGTLDESSYAASPLMKRGGGSSVFESSAETPSRGRGSTVRAFDEELLSPEERRMLGHGLSQKELDGDSYTVRAVQHKRSDYTKPVFPKWNI